MLLGQWKVKMEIKGSGGQVKLAPVVLLVGTCIRRVNIVRLLGKE